MELEAAFQRRCVAALRAEYPGVITYRHDGGDRIGFGLQNKAFCEGGRCLGLRTSSSP